VNHTWSSADLGADIIEVRTTDANVVTLTLTLSLTLTLTLSLILTLSLTLALTMTPNPNQVPTTDANFGLGQYYIAVYGGGGGTECRFTISVSSKRPLAGAGANAVLLEGGRANQVALAAVQADSRRKLVAAGRNARALMAKSAGTHGGATPEQRLAAVRAIAPSADSNLGGELGTSEAEIALKLGAALRVSIDFALAARQGGPAAITAEWLCQVLAHCTGYRQLASRAPLTTQGEPASFVAIVISGELQVAANPNPTPPRTPTLTLWPTLTLTLTPTPTLTLTLTRWRPTRRCSKARRPAACVQTTGARASGRATWWARSRCWGGAGRKARGAGRPTSRPTCPPRCSSSRMRQGQG
jgi:hypothetical protein